MQDLSPQSLAAIKNIVETVVDDKVRIATDLLRQEDRAMENRLVKHIDEKIDGVKTDIIIGVGEMITGHENRIIDLEEQIKA